VENAIKGGLTTLGFADHMPFRFPDGYESSFRIPMEKGEDYIASLRALREEYKNDIAIHIGFEMEYYPLYFKEMKQLACDLGAEFLLLSQHYAGNEHPGDNHYMGRGKHGDNDLVLYADTLIEGMGTGLFSYAAHPDLIHYTGEDADLYEKEMRRICKAAKTFGIPLEINLLGLRGGRHYPRRRFWEIAAEEGCTAVIGCDAHEPESVTDEASLATALSWIRELGLSYEPHPTMIHPKTGIKTETR
jgi:histidinol-phosphatase (PHP family)